MLTEEEKKEFYRRFYKKLTNHDPEDYIVEQCLPLKNDPELLNLGVDLCVETEVEKGEITNRLVFRRFGREGTFECNQNKCYILPNDYTESGYQFFFNKVPLEIQKEWGPEDNFLNMRSFADYLAKKGIFASILEGMKYRIEQARLRKELSDELKIDEEDLDEEVRKSGEKKLPKDLVDIDEYVRKNLLSALTKVAPEEMNLFTIKAIKDLSEGDVENVKLASEEFKSIINENFKDEDLFDLNQLGFRITLLDEDVKLGFAHKPDLREEFIEDLSADDNIKIREAIAGRTDIKEDLLRRMAFDDNVKVRYVIAQKPRLPEDIIKKFAIDDNEEDYIRIKVARRNDLPEDLMRRMASANSEWVRLALSERDDLPADIKAKFSNDESKRVRDSIKKRGE